MAVTSADHLISSTFPQLIISSKYCVCNTRAPFGVCASFPREMKLISSAFTDDWTTDLEERKSFSFFAIIGVSFLLSRGGCTQRTQDEELCELPGRWEKYAKHSLIIKLAIHLVYYTPIAKCCWSLTIFFCQWGSFDVQNECTTYTRMHYPKGLILNGKIAVS